MKTTMTAERGALIFAAMAALGGWISYFAKPPHDQVQPMPIIQPRPVCNCSCPTPHIDLTVDGKKREVLK